MITFDCITYLWQLSKDDLEKRIADMPEEEAKELLFEIMCLMSGKYRMTEEEVLRETNKH